MGVLDGDERGRRLNDVPGWLAGGPKVVGREQSAGARDRELHARVGGGGAGLMPDDVRFIADDDVVAGSCEQLQADLVRHRAARDEQRCLLAEQLGDALLQPVDARVFAVLVVADWRLGHGPAHAVGRPRHRVRAEIDQRSNSSMARANTPGCSYGAMWLPGSNRLRESAIAAVNSGA